MLEKGEAPCGCAGMRAGADLTYTHEPSEPKHNRIANAPAPGACDTGSAFVWALMGFGLGVVLTLVVTDVPMTTAYRKAKSKVKKLI